MHHTDYSQALRNARRQTTGREPSSLKRTNSSDQSSKDLRYAAVAALLVLASLFQMDPANAKLSTELDEHGILEVRAEGWINRDSVALE